MQHIIINDTTTGTTAVDTSNRSVLNDVELGVHFNSFVFSQMVGPKPDGMINIFSMLISTPIGIAIGIYMALRKNKWQDHVFHWAYSSCIR